MTLTPTLFVAITAIVSFGVYGLSSLCAHRVNARGFNRRNTAGFEVFDSYWRSHVITCLERTVRLICVPVKWLSGSFGLFCLVTLVAFAERAGG